jgi:phosphoribosylanthranilate isomerase
MIFKASAITNLTDARYFAAKEVDFLGFNLEEDTEGFLEPMYMKAIRAWVEGPKIVGEFAGAPLPVVREAAAFYGLDMVQVDARAGGHDWSDLKDLEVILRIKSSEIGENPGRIFADAAPFVRYFLLDFSGSGGAWQNPEWPELCGRYPVLLHLDEDAERIPKALQALGAAGLSLSGGEEERVGIKSFDELDELFSRYDR